MSSMDSMLVTDGANLSALKARVSTGDQATATDDLREVARQFESLFTHMLLKNMRSANLGEGAMDSEQSRFYRDMFDQQLASELADGRGLGIADMLVRQLGQDAPPPASRVRRSYGAVAAAAVEGPAISKPADDPISFIRRLVPHAVRAAKILKVAPQFLLAQAALETGWGQHTIKTQDGEDAHNLFGIKATGNWQGPTAAAQTTEFEDGQPQSVRDEFRAYRSEAESFADYARLLLRSPRYRDALNRHDDGAGFAHALQKGGYATDPNYARKIMNIAGGQTMRDALGALKIR